MKDNQFFVIPSSRFDCDFEDIIIDEIILTSKGQTHSIKRQRLIEIINNSKKRKTFINGIFDDIKIPKKIRKKLNIADVINPKALKSKAKYASMLLEFLDDKRFCFVVYSKTFNKKNSIEFGLILEHEDYQFNVVNSIFKGEIE